MIVYTFDDVSYGGACTNCVGRVPQNRGTSSVSLPDFRCRNRYFTAPFADALRNDSEKSLPNPDQ